MYADYDSLGWSNLNALKKKVHIKLCNLIQIIKQASVKYQAYIFVTTADRGKWMKRGNGCADSWCQIHNIIHGSVSRQTFKGF